MCRNIYVIGIIILLLIITITPITLGYKININNTHDNPLNSSGNTLYVGGSGPGNYSRIQWAIDDADPGDTVFVYNGTYTEVVEIYKSINLIGENNQSTLIQGFGPSCDNVVLVTANGVTIKGFSMTKSGSTWGDSGIAIKSNNNIIENNILYDNENGVYIRDSSNNIVRNCIFYENDKKLFLNGAQNCIVTDCYFEELEDKYAGIYLQGGVINKYCLDNLIINCTMINDGVGGAYGVINTVVKDCTITGSGVVFSEDTDCNTVKNCRIDSARRGVHFYDGGSNNLVENCVITNSYFYGIEFYGTQYDAKVINCTVIGSIIYDGLNTGNFINGLIKDCRFISNEVAGIKFCLDTWGTTVSNCYFNGNDYGIHVYRLANFDFNRFYNNCFSSKSRNFKITSESKPLSLNEFKGNYWDNYKGEDNDNDGIGDTPYIIDIWNKDKYPFMEPFNIDPNTPFVPEINGPNRVIPGREYTYSFTATDPNSDDVFLFVTWGDGTFEEWIGPYGSGEIVVCNHTWDKQGKCSIIVRAKDIAGLIGPWASLKVRIPRNKVTYNSFFHRYFERFPMLERLLSFIRGEINIPR